jgi:hypothetical protein
MRLVKIVFVVSLVIGTILVTYDVNEARGEYDDFQFNSEHPWHWGFVPNLISTLLYLVIKPHGRFISYYQHELIFLSILGVAGFLFGLIKKRKN